MNKIATYLRAMIVLVILMVSTNMAAQEAREPLSVKIDQIISTDYPKIQAYALIRNSKGELMQALSPGLFKFRIDSMEIKSQNEIIPLSLKEVPTDYSILFSNSGVMEGEPLDFQKNAILQFIDIMRPNDMLSLYAIGEEAVPVFEEQKKETIDVSLVNAVIVSPAQPRVYDSIINVARKVSRRKISRKVIVVISDGRDQNSRFTKEQLTNVLSETGLPVYGIGIRVLSSQSLSNLNEIADITGGTYTFSKSIKEIPDSLKRITSMINRCYLISMKIKGLKADNLPHHLEVTIDERDSFGKGQKTFVAIRNPIPKWFKVLLVVSGILFIVIIVFLWIFHRIQTRKRMGITKRRCPDCGNRMKDSWDSCPFCRYLPQITKKKKKKKE